jgi:hypothetical protein
MCIHSGKEFKKRKNKIMKDISIDIVDSGFCGENMAAYRRRNIVEINETGNKL